MVRTDFIVKHKTFMGIFSEKLFRCEKQQRNTHTTENTAIASTLKLHGAEQLKTCMIYGVLFLSVHQMHECLTGPWLLASTKHNDIQDRKK